MTDTNALAGQLEALAVEATPVGPYSVEAFNELLDGHDTMQAMIIAGDGESIFAQCMTDDAAFAVAEILNSLPSIIAALRATDEHPSAEDYRNRAERAEQALAERDAENVRLREKISILKNRRYLDAADELERARQALGGTDAE